MSRTLVWGVPGVVILGVLGFLMFGPESPPGGHDFSVVVEEPSVDAAIEADPSLPEETEAQNGASGSQMVAIQESGLESGGGTNPESVPEQVVADSGEEEGASFAVERAVIEEKLSRADDYSREDLLAMIGRTAASSGDFAASAAAYTMFMEEFGEDSPYSSRIARRLADSLAPLNLDSIGVTHTPSGPVYTPQYRMGYVPPPAHLHEAAP